MDKILEVFRSYTARLTPQNADRVKTILGLFAKFEDESHAAPAPS